MKPNRYRPDELLGGVDVADLTGNQALLNARDELSTDRQEWRSRVIEPIDSCLPQFLTRSAASRTSDFTITVRCRR